MGTQPDWSKLTFGLKDTAPMMYVATWTEATGWVKQGCKPYGNLSVPPAAQVFNYGQAIFEGMKALTSAKGRVVLFRPLENARRMQNGAVRMSMPQPPEALFLEGVAALVEANSSHVPPLGLGSMYIRPLLIGTGATLGLQAAPEVTLVIFSAAVGSYFAGGQLTPLQLKVEDAFHRAAPFGVGAAKCAGNYAAGLKALKAAKGAGFSDVVYLDARTDTYLEELSAANIFVVKGKTIRTPPLQGTILPGVTRDSVIQLARRRGYTVEEAPVSVTEALASDEIFTTGTAVVVCPVGSLTYKGEKTTFGTGDAPGPVCQELYTALTTLQSEEAEDPFEWVVPLESMPTLIASVVQG